MSKNIGKGMKGALKKLQIIAPQTIEIEIIVNWEIIEQKITNFNK